MFRMVARNALSSRLQYRRSPVWFMFLVLLACSLLTSVIGPTASAAPFSNASFQQSWQTADYPVAIGAVTRGYTWGDAPFFNASEAYVEGPGGFRQVAYFDKARMEITRPDLTKGNPYYVTNGLLVKEMVTGLKQDGDTTFSQRFPAFDVPVAGDPVEINKDAPTYASFYALNSFYHTIQPVITSTTSVTSSVGNSPLKLSLNPQDSQIDRTTLADVSVPSDTRSGLLERQPDRTNERADDTLNRDGTHNKNSLLGALDGANYVFWERTLGHNIPKVFWDYLNQTGPIFNGKGLVNGNIFDWVQTMGYPISDAYWVKTNVGGIPRDVMVQLYERRILTFTPTNPVQFRVEMGNVGQHYYKWRYNPKYDLNLPLQSNAEVRPEAGFPGSTFSIKVYGMLGNPSNGEDLETTVYTPDGLALVGQVVPAANQSTGFTFFPVFVLTDAATPPGQYEIKFRGTISGNEAKAYFFVLGIPGYNLPAA